MRPPFASKWTNTIFFSSSLCGHRKENQDNYLFIKNLDGYSKATFLEDQCIVERTISWINGFSRIAVTDGMGGHAGGREMAQHTIKALLTIHPINSPEKMREKVFEINSTLVKLNAGKERRKQAGTTLVWADMDQASQSATLVNVGDSRAYLLQKGKCLLQTHDHTLTEFSWRDGRIPLTEYKEKAQKKSISISQAIGVGSYGIIRDSDGYYPLSYNPRLRIDLAQELPPAKLKHADAIQFAIRRGDMLILATDGLWSHSKKFDLNAFASEKLSQKNVDALAQQAIRHGSEDNVTIVVCKFI